MNSRSPFHLAAPALHDRGYPAIPLAPRPAIWGKTNHIQWDRFRPRESSSTTWP